LIKLELLRVGLLRLIKLELLRLLLWLLAGLVFIYKSRLNLSLSVQVREGHVIDSEFEVFAMLHYHQSMLPQLEVVRVYTFKNLLLVEQLPIFVHPSSPT
jgi:hypothetical protein